MSRIAHSKQDLISRRSIDEQVITPYHTTTTMALTYVLLSALAALLVPLVAGHGRLMQPPSRSSAWRNGFPTPANYNDNELFCGGFWVGGVPERISSLKWCHNELVGVSNYQPPDCLLHRLVKAQIKETSKLHVTGLCEGNSSVTGKTVNRWIPRTKGP